MAHSLPELDFDNFPDHSVDFELGEPSQSKKKQIQIQLDEDWEMISDKAKDDDENKESDEPLFSSTKHEKSTTSKTKKSVKRREKEPQSFDGKSVDWKDFIVQFEQVAEWNRWSYGEMAQQLVMCLRGTAQKLLGDLPHSTLTDYASLKTSLGNRFHPQERESAYRCEFRTRRRQKDESSTDFGHALRRLGCLAFPNIPSQWREPFVVDQFISGLGNYEIRKHVAFHHPKTLEAAIALAVEFEAFEGCQGIRKPHVTFEEPRPLVDSVARSEKSEIEHLTRSLNECMQKLDKLSNEVRGNSYSNFRGRGRGRGGYSPRQGRYCNICKTQDHYTNQCPYKGQGQVDNERHEVTEKSENGSGN